MLKALTSRQTPAGPLRGSVVLRGARHAPIGPRRQHGAVLITALVMLLVLTMLGLSTMSTTVVEERMVANSQVVNTSFQVAESALAQAVNDEQGINLRYTEASPYQRTLPAISDYPGTRRYSMFYRQRTAPRRGSNWDSSYAFYHFNVNGIAELADGITRSEVVAGMYQVGRK